MTYDDFSTVIGGLEEIKHTEEEMGNFLYNLGMVSVPRDIQLDLLPGAKALRDLLYNHYEEKAMDRIFEYLEDEDDIISYKKLYSEINGKEKIDKKIFVMIIDGIVESYRLKYKSEKKSEDLGFPGVKIDLENNPAYCSLRDMLLQYLSNDIVGLLVAYCKNSAKEEKDYSYEYERLYDELYK